MTTDPADFRAALPGGGRLMALDVGSKTIGIAFCDAGWSIASADKTLPRGKFSKDVEKLRVIINAQNIVGIVIGLPLSLDGRDTPQTQSTRAFARNLQILELPILLWDERWSTMAVERAMIAADVSRAKRAAQVDAKAAEYILQGAIDALVQSGTLHP
ncbi:MAG: Holliday junction resolvase RuvX [Pseudomonadota bacterium]